MAKNDTLADKSAQTANVDSSTNVTDAQSAITATRASPAARGTHMPPE